MSKVYEALKKAQREGRWRDDLSESAEDAGDVHRVPADIIRPSTGKGLLPGAPAETAAEEHIGPETERSRLVDSLLDLAGERSETSLANGKLQNEGVATPASQFLHASIFRKVRLWWRLWQGEQVDGDRGPALIINQESFSKATEQFQVLRANVEGWAAEHQKRVILLTSALPGEGKSFVALNLAVALSQAGSNVLLVDADLRAPSLHLPFNVVPLGGLLPYLEGRAEFADSITAMPLPRLRLIAAAGTTLSGPEAFASSRMRALIENARQLQPPHIVLIDAPAAAAGTEIQILSKLADGALLVVGANLTPREAVTKTLELIKDAELLSVVLNRFELSYTASRQLRYPYARYKTKAAGDNAKSSSG
jgi:capsular exopolysaccharide synthesis family protein